VYLRRQFESVDQLKQALVTERNRLSQTFIKKSINEWRKRLQAVVRNNGAHVEHFFNSVGINFAKLTRVWLALIPLTAKISSLLFWATLYSYQYYVIRVIFLKLAPLCIGCASTFLNPESAPAIVVFKVLPGHTSPLADIYSQFCSTHPDINRGYLTACTTDTGNYISKKLLMGYRNLHW